MVRINRKYARKIHRYLGIVIGIQLFIWTLSGLFFSLIPIEEIRGNHLLKSSEPLLLKDFSLLSPSRLVIQHEKLAKITIKEIQLKSRLGRPVYEVNSEESIGIYDAVTGEKLLAVNREEAIKAGEERTEVSVVGAEYVEKTEIGSEYRGGELPAWRLVLEDGSHLYIGAESGLLRSVRTDDWRLYDFLWGLHIMDYEARTDFNNWLLKIMAGLAVITVLSGMILFLITMRRRPVTAS